MKNDEATLGVSDTIAIRHDIKFKYVFENFGTSFIEEKALKKNEIAADVGGECLFYEKKTGLIIDHHFSRDHNFPSASAAVLHLAPQIWSRLSGQQEIILKTHKNPDFDALCSLFLIRRILEGSVPYTGWEECGLHPKCWRPIVLRGKDGKPRRTKEGKRMPRQIDWFSPALTFLPPNRRSAVLFAAYASMVDQCKPLHCDRASALHSILYAGAQRGRDWETDGAYAFFCAAEERINQGMNPLYDAIFDETSEYAPELAMLRREEEHYRRDIARARRTIVNLPVAPAPFDQWFSQHLKKLPLFGSSSGDAPAPEHLCEKHKHRQENGVFLRDPECLLFKEWARADQENSPNGQGFLFTAIAYSAGCPDSKGNKSRYFFSLDPERANGAHLYPVWARLQARECKLAKKEHSNVPRKARHNFEARLAGSPCGKDPWFDGNNYQATIIDTPNFGTRLDAGVRSDLTNDKAAEIVRQELEWNIFINEDACRDKGRVVCIRDFPTSKDPNNAKSGQSDGRDGLPTSKHSPISEPSEDDPCPINLAIDELIYNQKPPQTLRLATVGLISGISTNDRHVAESIGKSIWPALADAGVTTVPDDFVSRHLWFDAASVVVWNRHGIAIASNSAEPAKALEKSLKQLATIVSSAETIAICSDHKGALTDGRKLLASIIQLQLQASAPHNTALRRLMDATRIDSVVTSVTALNKERFQEAQEEAQKRRDMGLQCILAVGTALGLFFAWNQVEQISFSGFAQNIAAIHGIPSSLVWIGALPHETHYVIRLFLGLAVAFVFILSWLIWVRASKWKK